MDRLSSLSSTSRHRSSAGIAACCAPRKRAAQTGFSLIEALVTLAILSVGLMGLAFLQAQGMQLNTSAYARTQASVLVGDILDRMRLNSGNVAAYDTGSFSPTPADCDQTLAPDATNDRDCWYERLQEALPGGDGEITFNAGTGVVTVTVRWRERPGGRRRNDFNPGSLSEADFVQSMSTSVAL